MKFRNSNKTKYNCVHNYLLLLEILYRVCPELRVVPVCQEKMVKVVCLEHKVCPDPVVGEETADSQEKGDHLEHQELLEAEENLA